MKHTKQLFMILLVVFLLVGLGTLAASDVTKNDTSVTKSTEVTKTNTVSKDTTSTSKISTTQKSDDNTKIVDTKPNSKTDETVKNKTINKVKTNISKTANNKVVNINNATQYHDTLTTTENIDTLTLNILKDIKMIKDVYASGTIKNIIINGNDKTINGDGTYNAFGVDQFSSATINNLQIRNASKAIRTKGNLILNNVDFYYCKGDNVVFVNGSKLIVRNNSFQDSNCDKNVITVINNSLTVEKSHFLQNSLGGSSINVDCGGSSIKYKTIISNNTFRDTTGVLVRAADAEITENTFNYIYKGVDGGTINWGSMDLRDRGYSCLISNNIIYRSTSSHCGGAIRTDGNVIIKNNIIDNANSGRGGAIAHYAGSLTLTNNTISNCYISNYIDGTTSGSAIYVNSYYWKASGTISNNTIYRGDISLYPGNPTTNTIYGSLIHLNGVTLTMEKNNIRNNNINYYNSTGLIYISNSTITMRYNNITQNSVTKGLIYNTNTGDLTLSYNNILKNKASTWDLIYNLGTMRITYNNITDNCVSRTNDYILNDSGNTQFINNFCKNNTDNQRDMLLNRLPSRIYGNTYIDNYLELEKENPFTNIGTKTTYNNNATVVTVNLNLRSAYNDTIRNGTVYAYVNGGTQSVASASVTNGIATISIPYNRLPNSSNTVNLTYQSLPKHYQNAKTSFTVNRRWNTKIEIQPPTGTITYNETKPIKFTLKDINNNVLSSKSLTITIDGKSYVYDTNTNGVVTVNHPFTNIGSRSISVRFAGSTPYLSSSNSTTINVVKRNSTATIIAPTGIIYNQTRSVTFNLKSDTGTPLSNQRLTVIIDDSTYTPTTNNNGVATVSHTFDQTGYVPINVSYAGNTYYNPSNNSTRVNVSPLGSTTIGVNKTTIINQSVNIEVIVKDSNGNNINSGTVYVFEGSTFLGTINLENSNYITYRFRSSGDHPLVFEFNGIYGIEGSIGHGNIYVNKLNTSIELFIAPTATIEDNVPVTVRLTDNTADTFKAISNREVRVTFSDGSSPINVRTNYEGIATFNKTFDRTGTITVTANFTGDSFFNSNETSTNVNVLLKESQITIRPINSYYGETEVEIILTDKNSGAPLTFQNVIITLPNGTNVPTRTDHDGKVTQGLNLPIGDNQKVNATFEGNSRYNSSKNSTILTVTPSPGTKITGTPVSGVINGSISTTVTVTDKNNQEIRDGFVEVFYGDQVIGYTDLISSKIISLTPFNKSINNEMLNLRYSGTNLYSPCNGTIPIFIDKLSTSLNLTISSTYMAPEDTTSIIVTLLDKNNKPVIGRTVTLYEGSQILISTQTNNNGEINYQYTPQTDGIKDISAECNLEYDQYYHSPQDTEKKIYVERIQTHLHIVGQNLQQGTQGNIIIDLHDFKHNNLSNLPVEIVIKELGEITYNETKLTDNTGKINITYTPISNDIIHVETKFTGNNRYRPATFEVDISPELEIAFINIDASNTIINKTNNIKINIRDKYNNPLDINFILRVDNTYINQYRTVNGEYNYTNFYSREYRAEVPVEVEIVEEGYSNTKETDTFRVDKIPTTTRVFVLKNTVRNTTLRVEVSSEINLVNTGEVIILHNGEQIGSGQVQNGYAIITTPLTSNKYNLNVIYGENNYFLTSQNNTGDFDVIKLPTQTTAKVINNTVGNVTLDITVTNDEEIVTDGNVLVLFNNTVFGNGRVHNGKVIISNSNVMKGNYTFLVKYEGTDIFLESKNETVIDLDNNPRTDITVVGKISNISATPYSTVYRNSSVYVTLIDPETNRPLANQQVIIIDDEGKIVGSNITDDNGNKIITVDIPIGTSYLTAIYEGNNEYNESRAPVTMRITKIPTNTSATRPTIVPGSPIIVPVKVVESNTGKPVDSGNITIKNGEQIVGTGSVRIDGTSDVQLRNLKAGIYNLTVEFSGTNVYINSSDSDSLKNIIIPQQEATITAKPENTYVDNASISVNLTDKNTGAPIAYANINITLPNGINVTGQTNENGIAIIPVDLPAGYHRLPVTFIGDDSYNPVTTTTPINIEKIPTTVKAETLDTTAGYVSIRANVTETITGKSVTKGYVFIKDTQGRIFSDEIEVNSNGVAILPTTIGEPGKYNLIIVYKGTPDKYLENDTTLYDVTINPRPSVVTGTPNNQTFKNTNIDVDLKDKKTGDIIPYAPITIYQNGVKIGNGTTDSDGKARIPVTIPIGEHDVIVMFAGDERYEKSTDNVHLSIKKLGTKVESLPVRGKINQTLPVTIVVTDDVGDNVTNGIVEVRSTDGTLLGNVNLEQTNVINIKFSEGKQQELRLKYLGNMNLTESMGTGMANIIKLNTTLNMTAPNIMHPGDIVEINATLLDENNKAISGEIVQIVIDGKVVHTQNTDNNGKINYTYSATEIGTVNVVARYNGHTSPYYNSAQDTEKDITISKLQTTININNKVLVAHENNKINITLTDENQKALGGKDVTVTIKEPNLKATTVTGRTTSNGNLIVDYTPRNTNNIRIDAQFGGDDRYTPSSTYTILDANRLATQITVTATDTIINQTNTITIKLSDKNNNPLSGRVLLDIGGQRVNVDVNNGEATYTSYSSPYSEEISVTATYPGSEGLEVSTATTEFFVDKIPTTTSTKFINQTAGNVQLEVTVNDKINNKPVNDGPITLTIGDNVIATGNIKDGKAIIPLNIPTPGDYNIIVTYLGNEYFHPSTNNIGDVEIERIPTTTIAVITENIAGNVVFDVGVITEDGVARDGKVIMKANGTPIGEGEVQNGVVQISCTLPDTSGQYEFTAEYQGTNLYLPSKGNVTDIVEGRPSRIIPKQTNTTIGNTTVKVNLTDPTLGEPLAYEPIEIYDQDGKKIGEGTTGHDGTVDIKVDLPVGEHPVTVNFPGSPTNKPTNKTITLQVEKKPSQTNADKPTSDRIGEIQIPVTVIDPATGRPITNGNITITLPNGRPVGQATITGTITQVPITITTPGKYNLTVKYNGNNEFLPSQYKLEDIDARKINTELNVTPNTNGNITINLTDEDKNPMPNAPVVITLPNGTQIETKTTQNGTVTVPINLPPGEYPILVEYPGNETHNPSNKTTTLQIPKIPTNTTVEILDTTIGNVTIKVTVTNKTGDKVNTGTITILNENNIPITTLNNINLKNGEATIKLPITTAGTIKIKAHYNENNIYNESYAINKTTGEPIITLDVTKIPTKTTVEILNNTLTNVTIKVKVTNMTNVPVTTGTITILNENNMIIQGNINLRDGEATIQIPATTAGTIKIKAHYNENNIYNESYAINKTTGEPIITLDVTKIPTKTTVEILNNTLTNVTIKVKVTNMTNVPVTTGTITILNENNMIIQGNINLRDGEATIQIPATTAGTIKIKAHYNENNIYNESYAINKTTGEPIITLDVTKIPTKTTVEILNNTLTNVTIKVKVTNMTNVPVTTGTITILNENNIPITTLNNINLNNGEATIKLPITTAGETTIKVKYNENELYNESYAKNQTTGQPEIKITVEKIPTKTTVEILDTTIGNVTIKVRVTNSSGDFVTKGNITILNENNIPITTLNNINLNNGEATIKLPITIAGTIKIKAHYNENNIYNESYAINKTTGEPIITIDITKIPTTTTITVNGNTVKNINATGRVIDKFNKLVTEGTIIIKNGNTEVGRATITNGQYNIPLNINTQGRYNLIAQYLGTNTYLPSNSITVQVTVNPRPSQITGKPEGSIAGTTNVTATLKDPETGKPITNAPITVTLPNGNKITATTDNNGNVKVPVDLPKGNNKVKVDYPGNSTYKPSTTTVDVPVTGKTPSIKVTPEGDKIGNSNVITVLTDPITGKPIPNAPIIVTLPNGSKVPGTTGPDGSVKIPLDLRNTDNNITVDYLGNGTYNPVTSKINIKLDKNDPIIKLNPVRGVIGEDITLTAYLTDKDGNPITGGNLAFKLNGKTLRADGRFDSTAPAMKFNVKDGFVTYTIKADLYLRNAKNLTAAYSGNYKYKETGSPTVEAQIQKRYAGVTLTVTPTQNKQYDTLTFTATVQDVTKNGKNQTLINQDTKVMFKVNGNTLRDKNGQIIYTPVGKDLKAIHKYTIPAGTGGITANKKVRDYKVDAVFVGINYYPGSRNNTYFNVERSPITININEAKASTNNILSIKATIKDYKGNNVVGTNKYTIKVNGKSYTDKNGKPVYWSAKNGVINLSGIQIDPKTIIKRVMIVTGERQAYLEGRAETTTIVRA